MVETEGHKPFLTIQVSEGDAGTYARCPELHTGLGIGPGQRDEVIKGVQEIVKVNAQIITRREDITGHEKEIAQRIVEELKQGVDIADLFKDAE